MSALTLVGEELLNVEIEGVLVYLDAEYFVVEDCLAAGVLTFLVVYCEFHILTSRLK